MPGPRRGARLVLGTGAAPRRAPPPPAIAARRERRAALAPLHLLSGRRRLAPHARAQAPGTDVTVNENGTAVSAPGTTVVSTPEGTGVLAPFAQVLTTDQGTRVKVSAAWQAAAAAARSGDMRQSAWQVSLPVGCRRSGEACRVTRTPKQPRARARARAGAHRWRGHQHRQALTRRAASQPCCGRSHRVLRLGPRRPSRPPRPPPGASVALPSASSAAARALA